jgi:membrane complex biogenesis BtpA family protein
MPAMFDRSVIGMVHASALPGTPFSRESIDAIVGRAVAETRVLVKAGFDGLIVENMHDRPYVLAPHGPEVTAAMTRIVLAVREAAPSAILGIQILSAGEHEAMAVALAAGADFIRCENFVYAHVADEGLLGRAAAGPLLRYRRSIGAQRVKILCDLKKKHASHAITADLTIADAAHAAALFGADGVVVTGGFTGRPASEADLAEAREACSLPVVVGSGVTPAQLGGLFRHADALIVGSYTKKGGLWSNPVDPARCRELVAAARSARSSGGRARRPHRAG